jgi:dTDP-4-dehydrorhamnose reductase
MNPRRTILITGGTGLLGRGLGATAPESIRIISIHLRDYDGDSPLMEQQIADVCDKHQVDNLFDKYQFDAVIHTGGIADVDYVQSNYAEGLESNLVGTLNIVKACRRCGCRLVYASTNAVFDGQRAPYDEKCKTNPVNEYGKIKEQCERLVTKALGEFVIVRPILMYGWNHKMGRTNMATWILSKLRNGESINIVNDVYENPLYNIHCGEAIWQIIDRKISGVIHLAGRDIVSRYVFAKEIANVFDLDPSLIKPVDSSFFPHIAPRPKNTSYVTIRMEAELGMPPLPLREGLLKMRDSVEE